MLALLQGFRQLINFTNAQRFNILNFELRFNEVGP
jgi:hypothetical protein